MFLELLILSDSESVAVAACVPYPAVRSCSVVGPAHGKVVQAK